MPGSIREDHDLIAACAEGDEQALGSLYDRFGTVAYAPRAACLARPGARRRRGPGGVPRRVAAGRELRPLSRKGVDLDSHARAPTSRRSRAPPDPLQRASGPAGGAGASSGASPRASTTTSLFGGATRGSGSARNAVEAEREVLSLAYWGGLTQSEIATALGIPSGTVKSRTFNALTRLRESLRQGTEPTAVYSRTRWPELWGTGHRARPPAGVRTERLRRPACRIRVEEIHEPCSGLSTTLLVAPAPRWRS